MEQEFLDKLTDLMDTEQEITMETKLKEIEEWDSLSFVAFLAMANSTYQKSIKPVEVRSAQAVKDLYNLVSK